MNVGWVEPGCRIWLNVFGKAFVDLGNDATERILRVGSSNTKLVAFNERG